MEPGSICVARELNIDAARIDDVLRRLRRDVLGREVRWMLGDRGTLELDVHFVCASDSLRWATTGRLWDPDNLALVAIVAELVVRGEQTCELSLRPSSAIASWWDDRRPALFDLAHAALDETAEELLWHASRGDVPTAH